MYLAAWQVIARFAKKMYSTFLEGIMEIIEQITNLSVLIFVFHELQWTVKKA